MQGLWERVELLGRTPEDPGMLRRAVAFSLAGPRGGVARADFYINFITLAAMLGTDTSQRTAGFQHPRDRPHKRWGPAGLTPTGGTPSSVNGPEDLLGRVGCPLGPTEETGPSVLGCLVLTKSK